MIKSNLSLAAIMATLLIGGALFATGTQKTQAAQNDTQESRAAQKQERLAREAKVTMEQARETALKRAPGNVESSELEREHRKLVYSFDIRNAKGTITEVQISAITGKVVRVEHENKKQEAAEKRREQREKTRQP